MIETPFLWSTIVCLLGRLEWLGYQPSSLLYQGR